MLPEPISVIFLAERLPHIELFKTKQQWDDIKPLSPNRPVEDLRAKKASRKHKTLTDDSVMSHKMEITTMMPYSVCESFTDSCEWSCEFPLVQYELTQIV